MSRRLKLFPFFSGILLALSYPPAGFGFLGWLALIPFLLAISNTRSKGQAAKVGFIAGLTFFSISLYWMVNVHILAWILLVPLEASFFVLFALFAYQARERKIVLKSLWIALAWLTSELIRSEFPIFGLGWNLLAYTQTQYLPIAQLASLIGAYGLSFVIALVNALISYFILDTYWKLGGGKLTFYLAKLLPLSLLRGNVVRLFALFAIFFLTVGYGVLQLKKVPASPDLRVTSIQGNIPQHVKWRPEAKGRILEIYHNLTSLASTDSSDLILWPEAAFPGYFNRSFDAERIRELARSIQTPILLGSPHLETQTEAYNSAYLLDTEGQVAERYDKQFLVPFGEYVPLQPFLSWLEPVARSLGISDFYAGKEFTLFSLPQHKKNFATLICFEDVFPRLARNFVKEGADFLAVITNDAWFGKTAAPYQHLQASIFRAIENGVSVVRSANTGISTFISPLGQVLASVEDGEGRQIYITGRKTHEISTKPLPTYYKQGGWLFAYGGAMLFLLWFALRLFFRKKEFDGKRNHTELAVGVLLVLFAFSGCIRISGGAGYWKQGAEDPSAQVKQVGFDTQGLIPGAAPSGRIEIAE